MLPDNTALVGERTTGRILRVQPQPGQPVQTVRTLGGLDASGDGGLMDLAISPHYAQDNLIYAYVTTTADNRVVEFTLTGPVTPVVAGIPKGKVDNTGRLAFDGAGNLYIGTGDAGHPELAADPASLAGKVLRVSDVGRPAAGNPVPSSPVYTSGHRVVAGLCFAARQDTMIEVEGNHINALVAGANYGWPRTTSGTRKPVAVLPAVAPGPGGCAVALSQLYITSLDGQSVLSTLLTSSGTTVITGRFSAGLVRVYGRLRTIVAAADGALWLTTSNRDGHGTSIAADERVLRILASSLGTSSSPV
jgi:glucose/arabinose dehydrogenase